MADEAGTLAEEEEQASTPDSESAPDGAADFEPAPDWSGYKLDEMGGSQVGKVEGVISADGDSPTEWLLARMGRFGHYCLVPGRDAVAANKRIWVPYTRDEIRRAPRVEPGGPPSDALLRATAEHYGRSVGSDSP